MTVTEQVSKQMDADLPRDKEGRYPHAEHPHFVHADVDAEDTHFSRSSKEKSVMLLAEAISSEVNLT